MSSWIWTIWASGKPQEYKGKITVWILRWMLFPDRYYVLEAPSHYLNQCWLIISEVQWQSPDGNVTIYTAAISDWNLLENHLPKISLKSPRDQWVKHFKTIWVSLPPPLPHYFRSLHLMAHQTISSYNEIVTETKHSSMPLGTQIGKDGACIPKIFLKKNTYLANFFVYDLIKSATN